MDISGVETSPRLKQLAELLASGSLLDLQGFWKEMEARGAPLVEAIPGKDHQVLVTFLFRDGRDQAKIGVVSNLTGKMGEFQELVHLPGSDIWYRTVLLPSDTRETYQISVDGQNITDPLNRQKYIFPVDEDTGIGGWESSILELPDAPAQPWFTPRPGIQTGQVVKYYLDSRILGNTYPVWLYTPPGYSHRGEAYGFLLMLDGWFYTHLMPTPVILDNLLADGRLPPLAAVLVGSLAYAGARKRDYGCYPPYLDFLTQELLPWARQKIHLSDDPKQAAVGGSSRGGLMAAYIGLQLPEVFGNVLSQSGSFGWHPEGDSAPDWLIRQFASTAKLPLQFYLEAGRFETDIMMVDGCSINLLESNRNLHDVLKAKGYPLTYREFSGGHNPVIWRGTLADGLLALFGKE